MLATVQTIGGLVFICFFAFSLIRETHGAQSSEFFVKSERQSNSPNGSETRKFDYSLKFPRGGLQGTATSRYARYYRTPREDQRTSSRSADPFGSGFYGLSFVAPSSYGYGSQGAYGNNPASNQYYNDQSFAPIVPTSDERIAIATLGPGRYAFPLFDYGSGFGGFGGLGYLGQNLGFAYPGYGLGNRIFSEGTFPMRHF